MTYRTYILTPSKGWMPVKGSLKPTKEESKRVAKYLYPTYMTKTVVHSTEDEHD